MDNRTRATRRRGRLEGLVVGLVVALILVCVLGLALVTMAPAEMYRPAPATIHPAPSDLWAPSGFVHIPPCVGHGKDCEMLSWADPTSPARTVPEPGTLALVFTAAALLTWRGKS